MSSVDNGGQQGAQQGGSQQVTTSTSGGQMVPTSQVQVQVQQQQQSSPVQQQQQQGLNQQQQIQLQQTTTTTAIHGAQQHQANHGNAMQQLLIQQPIQQNSSYLQNLQQLFSQGQILMPGNILSHNLNSQIQVIGKPFQQNQLSAPHMLTTANYAIPTSGANNQVNQSYIIGNIGNLQAPMFQHQQGAKQADMQKVISQQLGTQLPQGLTWTTSPHTFLTSGQNSYLIRGAQPDQQLQFLQQQIQNNTATHQQFMPLGTTTSQLPNTSIAPATTPVQHGLQQQGTLQHQGQQQQQIQSQPHPIQPQPANVVSIKAPAALQPKPPLQIQPTPQIQHQQQQQQQMHQQLQVTMTQQQPQQIQMIPQTNTSQTSILPQSISITQSQAHVLQQAQQHFQSQQQHQQPRHLTILPQGQQPHQMIIQQQPQQQQPQAIRPNYAGTAVNVMTTQTQVAQTTAANGPTIPQQRAKIRKGVGRGTTNGSPTQAPRPQFPRGTTLNPIPNIQQKQQGSSQQQLRFHEVTKAPSPSPQQLHQQQHQMVQPLKTINLSALQPNLPDATLTPLIPNSTQSQQHHQTPAAQSNMPQQLHVFTSSSTQLPSPNISITPSLAPQTSAKKDDHPTDKSSEGKGDLEKENSKANGSDDTEELTAKQKLPKAMVKPQVLTHVIEGFVIHEAAEPFPMPKNIDMDEPPKKKAAMMSGEMGKCEMCGKVDLKAKFKKNKRFCTSACAKGMKASQQQQQQAQTTTSSAFQSNHSNFEEKGKKGKAKKWGEGGDGNTTDETNSSVGETSTLSPHEENMDTDEPKVNPMKWGVCEVVDFVKSLPGCAEYAEDFAVQEIDGQALMLIKEDHLMSGMGMKLGPALKLCAKIDVIRSASSNNSAGESNSKKS